MNIMSYNKLQDIIQFRNKKKDNAVSTTHTTTLLVFSQIVHVLLTMYGEIYNVKYEDNEVTFTISNK